MNLIELILHIDNEDMERDEAFEFLTDTGVHPEVVAAVIDCMDTDNFVHSVIDPQSRDHVAIFPLRYEFVREEEGENYDAQVVARLTVEEILNIGTPLDPDDETELVWNFRVAVLPVFPEAPPTAADKIYDLVEKLHKETDLETCEAILEWSNSETTEKDLKKLAKLIAEGKFRHWKCPNCGEPLKVADVNAVHRRFPFANQPKVEGLLCEKCTDMYEKLKRYADGEGEDS